MSPTDFMQILMMFSLPISGGSDLLDLVSTDTYWKARDVQVTAKEMVSELRLKEPPDIQPLIKQLGDPEFARRRAASSAIREHGVLVVDQLRRAENSKDPEISDRVRKLLRDLNGGSSSIKERRLMAIRTLGEMRHRESLPLLKDLFESREPFVADYAKRAAALINEEKYERAKLTKAQREEDLWLLPEHCGLVAQLALPRNIRVDLRGGLRKFFGGKKRALPLSDVEKKVFAKLLDVTSQMGNCRFDSITVAMGNEFGDNRETRQSNSFVTMVIRGEFDRDAIVEAMSRYDTLTKVQGIPVLKTDRNTQIILASNHRLVILMSDAPQPQERFLVALRSGRGKLAKNKKMVAVLNSVDRTKPVWGAIHVGPSYRRDWKMLWPVESVIAEIDLAGTELSGHVTALGNQAIGMTYVATSMKKDIDETIKSIEEDSADDYPIARIALQFLKSVRIKHREKEVRLSSEHQNLDEWMLFPFALWGYYFLL